MPRLAIENLNQRHPGVSLGLSLSYFEAARVCLTRHHVTPSNIAITFGQNSCEREVVWIAADDALKAAWRNEIDATEAGAYGLSLAAVEDQRNLVAVGRAETKTGVDYLLAPAGSRIEDFESSVRLEVSGTDTGNHAVVEARLREKLEQARRGDKDSPAIAAVVGFRILQLSLADLEVS